ncbi:MULTISPECIES: hypothetical protein [unclassified Streptomyces]|uniref:hypothetical protein n=1 Tax=unclassified Streptomyces TaxID=2593676 RepID=UPI0033F6CA78
MDVHLYVAADRVECAGDLADLAGLVGGCGCVREVPVHQLFRHEALLVVVDALEVGGVVGFGDAAHHADQAAAAVLDL